MKKIAKNEEGCKLADEILIDFVGPEELQTVTDVRE